MEIDDIIYRLAYRPIKQVNINLQNSIEISVTFEDGTYVSHKIQLYLLIWTVIIQHLHYEPIHGNTDHCIESPLLYFDLLGFRPGDAVVFRNAEGILFYF